MEQVVAMLRPAKDYFENVLLVKLAQPLSVFKALRCVNPLAVAHLALSVEEFRESVESLERFSAAEVDEMVSVFGPYKAMCVEARLNEGEKPMEFIVRFWQVHSPQLKCPSLSKLVRYGMTVQVSSAAAERVFSFLKSNFNDKQEGALADYVQLSLMLRFNV
jgi:hypothetical protein